MKNSIGKVLCTVCSSKENDRCNNSVNCVQIAILVLSALTCIFTLARLIYDICGSKVCKCNCKDDHEYDYSDIEIDEEDELGI
ncbi:MAG: hypothetical protein IJ446_07335 [Oscillospiraceae bacterium]|nr:hypothetical protein [Oscillospiraceae bacterium]